MRCALQILTLLSLSLGPARAQQLPPPTPAAVVVDTFFGAPLADPYRWLEDLESPAVRGWFRAQGAYARAALDALPGHAALLERFRQIDAAAAPDISLPREAGGRWFYTMQPPAESVARGYVRELRTGEERLLVDPTEVPGSGGEAGRRLATFLPSPDGRLVLYGVMTGGTEEVVLRVRDVGTGRDVEGPIERNQWDELAFWDPGGRAFFYAQIRDPGTAPASERFVGIRLVRHRLGTDPDSDVAVLSAAALDEEPGLFPWVDLDPRSAVALGRLVGAGGYSAYYTTSAAAVASGTPEWQPLFPISDSILAVVPHETDLYVLTRRGAGSVLRTPLDAPDLHTADTVLTADERTKLQNMSAARDGLYVQLFSEGVTRLTRIPWGGSPQPIELPSGTSIASDGFDNEVRTNP
ncbi:MAG TPA: hypothetical protein VK939_08365, partial [Longimicrobiales bacterium]|nr:hypothetical protein [Longimicrobiales bacterium]